MNKIKMIDEFNPLLITYSKAVDWAKLESASGELHAVFFSQQACVYAAIAINAYDTNQSRIAELEAEVKLLRGCNESPSVSPTITAGCYCTDIETEAQYVATCEALVKLGCLASGFYSYPDSGMCSYRDEYLINGNVGWVEPSMEISNGIYHAKGDLRHCFTTLVSHRDIIKAAEGL